MGILEVLTLVFIVLKLTGVIDWSWLAVCSPLIASFVIYVLWLVVTFILPIIFFKGR